MNPAQPFVSREFGKYIAASILTALGNGMHFVGVSWYLFQRTGSTAAIGWLLIVSTLPGVLFAPWIGALLDRWRDQTVCVWADVLRGLILCTLPLSMYFNAWVTETIYVTTFLMAIGNIFFQPAVSALVRDISSKDHLLKANIIGNMSMQIGMLSGASLGGLLVAMHGAGTVIVLNIVSFFVSAALTLWIKSDYDKFAHYAQRTRLGFATEFRNTITYFNSKPFIIWLAVLQTFCFITLYVCNTLLPGFVVQELRLDSTAFGLIDAAWGVGALAGGLILPFTAKRLGRWRLASAGLMLLPMSLSLFATASGTAQAVAGYFMLGGVICMVRVNTDTILATEISHEYFGRIKSTITMMISYASLIIYGLVGLMGDLISIRWIYLMLAGLICVSAAVRQLKPAQVPGGQAGTPEASQG